jgi:SOS-response transcriptional repressor LexA
VSASAQILYFFPPAPVLHLKMPVNWRARLRAAIDKSGKKHGAIAADAGVDPTTLSRILNARMQPTFDTVVRLARALDENVGWILDERGFTLSADEQKQLRKVVRFLDDALLGTAATRRDRLESNALADRNAEIPRAYAVRGARLAYEAVGDSMLGAGIADRDTLFVRPTRSMREASGRVVVCRADEAEYVKVLDLRAGRIRLLSRHDRYPPIEITESTRFELIGIVVGRAGAV